jgi:hypothetical protein
MMTLHSTVICQTYHWIKQRDGTTFKQFNTKALDTPDFRAAFGYKTAQLQLITAYITCKMIAAV